MKYNIHVTQAAERDMANAYDYIDLVLKNPTAADKLLDVADEKIGALAEFPHKFEVVSDKLLSLWGIRFTIVMNYLAWTMPRKPCISCGFSTAKATGSPF